MDYLLRGDFRLPVRYWRSHNFLLRMYNFMLAIHNAINFQFSMKNSNVSRIGSAAAVAFIETFNFTLVRVDMSRAFAIFVIKQSLHVRLSNVYQLGS